MSRCDLADADEAIDAALGCRRVKSLCERCRKPGSRKDPLRKVGRYRLHESHLLISQRAPR